MRDLGTLGGRESEAFDLNDQGQVVGWADTAEGDHHPFLWDPAAGMTDLETFGRLVRGPRRERARPGHGHKLEPPGVSRGAHSCSDLARLKGFEPLAF